MTARLPRVFNIAPGGHFLDELARAVLSGFPVEDPARPLSDWTILLPTRRAARIFAEILRARSGTRALVLPRIRPIGDLDEDRLAENVVSSELPDALPPLSQLFVLLDLVKAWLAENQKLSFAREIESSPLQILALAESLNELLQRIETQECGFDGLKHAYDVEFSEHREALLSLLSLLSTRMPEIHARRGTLGATARRSLMIRLEAERVSKGGDKGPIIAAGSTGTIPATRALLEAIARHAEGAVILPGLDQYADDESWDALASEHPQFALKELLGAMGLRRNDVQPLGANGRRVILSSELMRPSATTEHWHVKLPQSTGSLKAEAEGLIEIAAPDRHIEARAIALVLRETLAQENQTATLVTPDRDLAARVASEMERYGVMIEDSAGTNLSRLGLGGLLHLICSACTEGFSATSLMAILRHVDVTLGWDKAHLETSLRQLELAALRGLPLDAAEMSFGVLVASAHKAQSLQTVPHPLVKSITPEAWVQMEKLAAALDRVLESLRHAPQQTFARQLVLLQNSLAQLAPQADWQRPVNAALADLLLQLQEQGAHQPDTPLADVALILQHVLHKTNGPPSAASHRRLAILGALEARLMPADVMVLGGLNEGVWSAQADPGPWLNRTMRAKMGLPQPECEIGLAAHDFVQGLGHGKVFITWSARLGDAPATPSRWLLRLQTVLKTAGLQNPAGKGHDYVTWAKVLHQAQAAPVKKPRPRPPLALRPTVFSATAVERLVRNPYAIFARSILKLEPLPEFGFLPDAAMRGSLFHDAIKRWNEQQAPDAASLLQAGQEVFAPFQEQHEIRTFWWPQFLRVATWLAEREDELKQRLLRIHAEVRGELSFEIAGVKHRLTARADRIDALQNGARIIDYKTGVLPTPKQVESGLSPQLPLEAAILIHGGFANLRDGAELEALYLRISASMKGLEQKSPTDPSSPGLRELAEKHLAGLKALLLLYQNETQPYLPRLRVFKEEDEADFDHLSRYLEWQLAGES